MIFQLILFIIVNLIAFLGCQLLSVRVNSKKSFTYRFLLGIVYFLFQIQLSILVLGVIGELSKFNLFTLNTLISGTLIIGLFRNTYSGRRSTFKNKVLELRDIGHGYVPLSLFAAFSFITLIRIVIFPPHVWDVLTYHLLAPINWFQSGSISILNTPVDRANFNFLGTKTYNLWTLYATDSLMFVELTSFSFTFFLLLIVFAILRIIGLNYYYSSVFSVLSLAIPTILIQMRTTHDHTPILAMTFLLIYLLMWSLVKKKIDHTHLVNIVMVSGLMVGLKVHGIIYLVLLFLLFGFLSWRSNIETIIKPSSTFSKIAITAILILSIVLGSFWGVRNYYQYSNFFGPSYTQDALDKSDSSNRLFSAALSLSSNLLKNISHAPTRILDFGEPYSVDSTRISSYGISFFSFGLIGYLSVLFLQITYGKIDNKSTNNKVLVLLISFSFLTQIILYSLYFTYFNYRILTIFPIVGIILAAYSISKLDLNKQQRLFLTTLISFLLVFSYLIMSTTDKATPARARFVSEKPGQDAIANFSAILNDEWTYISLIPAEKTIAYHTHEDGFVLPYYDKGLRRRVISLDKVDHIIENQILSFTDEGYEDLIRLNIDYIHINNQYSTPKHDYQWVDDINSDRIEHIWGGLYKVIRDE